MKTQSELVAKWSAEIMEDGFTAIPNFLIDHMVDIGINPIELSVIIAIERHRFFGDTAYPSNERISRITGYSPRHVSRITSDLQKRKLIKKIKRPYNSVLYDFKPLAKALKVYKMQLKYERKKFDPDVLVIDT